MKYDSVIEQSGECSKFFFFAKKVFLDQRHQHGEVGGGWGLRFKVGGEGEEEHSYGKYYLNQPDGIGDELFGSVYKGLGRV